MNDSFTFVDLFAGIGGFHSALESLGGTCVLAVENDPAAARVYESNWGVSPLGDVRELTSGDMNVPPHDVLTAGFPCQPFSKAGKQEGLSDVRGDLFFAICNVLQARHPPIVMLENVRNLAGRRQLHAWFRIIKTLREIGYVVSDVPAVFSPHLLPPEMGGQPQSRERVFIMGVYAGHERSVLERHDSAVVKNEPVADWNPLDWSLDKHLTLEAEEGSARQALS